MNARIKLNSSYLNGCLLFAALVRERKQTSPIGNARRLAKILNEFWQTLGVHRLLRTQLITALTQSFTKAGTTISRRASLPPVKLIG